MGFRDTVSDISGLLTLGLLLCYVHYLTTPYQRGFFCDDETIRYPHKQSTVSSGLCYGVGSGVNLLLILVIEFHNLRKETRQSLSMDIANQQFPTRVYLTRVYYRVIVWLFGAISSELLTDIAKITCGRLRPHFLDVCKPVITKTDPLNPIPLDEFCKTDGSEYGYTYIHPDKYRCTGEAKKLRDIRLSFLSGHSSYSSYSAVFALLYIQSTVDIREVGLFKPSLQVLLASMAYYTGLSRVSDYKHHWQDVLAGLALGTSVAYLISSYMRPQYLRSKSDRNGSPRVSNDNTGTELGPA